MQSRLGREGALGLLILAGVLGLSGLFYWVLNLRVGDGGYGFTVQFDDAGGLLDGGAVRLRGVDVGRIEAISSDVDAVRVRVQIDSANTVVPLRSEFLSSQTGLIGATSLDIVPSADFPAEGVMAGPLDERCDITMIVCADVEVEGSIGVSYSQLVQKMDRLLSSFEEGDFASNLNQVAGSVTEVSDSVTEVAASVTELSETIQNDLDFVAISEAAASVQTAADELSQLVQTNQVTLETTLADLSSFSADMAELTGVLAPTLGSEVFVGDLQTISSQAAIASENAVAATEDLRVLTESFSDPDTMANLRATLDAARVTFENAQKITTDLDELTGDAQFRESLRQLVLGLNDLVSLDPLESDEELFGPQIEPAFNYKFTVLEHMGGVYSIQ